MPEDKAKAKRDLNSANNSDTGTGISSFPDKSNVPDGGKLPSRYGKSVNLVGDKKNIPVVDMFRAWTSKNIRRFEGQSQREKFTENGGVMDIADRMSRVSLNQDSTNTQTRDTLSDVTSPMFLVQMRAITASEMAIYFSDDERLPAEYSPEINTNEYTADDGRKIAEHQNALQQLTFDEDGRKEKIRDIIHWTNIYGNQVVKHGWARETREVTQHEPDRGAGINENGTFKKFKTTTKKRVTKDWPTIERWPIENCYFDSHIPEAKDQICFGYKTKVGYGQLAQWYADGVIDNLGELTASQKYKGEHEAQQPLEQRMVNAGENDISEETGEIEIWEIWARVPISQNETPKRKSVKAVWDESKQAPTIYQAIFAGNIHQSPVCLKLCENPHWHGEMPITLIHSHQDNKGAYHKGDAEMIQSLYYQSTTNLNQAIDNITKRNSAPMVANGPIHTRDLTYKANKLIKIDRSTELTTLDIPDTTQLTMTMHSIIEEQANKLTGADKPLRAEALGSRTSATEAKNVFDQAMQPLDERASYMAAQLFEWMFRLDAEAWRQYGDPNTVLRVTHNDTMLDINPGNLWGPIRTQITAMTRFKNNNIRTQEKNNFLQNILPMFLPHLEPEGVKILGRQTLRQFGFEKVDEIFPVGQNVDAEARAQQAVQAMLVAGEYVEPQSGENHAAWLPVLERAASQYKLLPEGEFRPNNHQMILFHIQMRRDMLAQEKAQAAQAAAGGQQAPGGTPPEGLPGEIAGNPLEAEGGAQANLT
jgi:hypothetical protein